MNYRQQLPYAVRAGRSKTDLCRYMDRGDACVYACERSNSMRGIRYYVVYNPRRNITDYEEYYLDGVNHIV
jgi:hypothetical protein